MERSKPNIIVFFSDQQRYDTIGCYGQELDITPNIDKMAFQGVRFEYAFTCQPVCGPARACIQTGRWATQTGCYRNDKALPKSEKTIAHWLSEAGYETAYIGKWHLASDSAGERYRDRGVPAELRGGYKDYWLASDALEHTSHGYDGHMYDGNMNKVEFKGYRADCLTDFAIDYLRDRRKERPLFLFISYLEPHHQNDRNRFEGPEGSKEKYKSFKVPGDLEGTGGDWRENYPDYLGACASLDYNLGRLRDELQLQGMADNTVVFYISDHGCHFRTRNGEYKRSCHESSIRIPFIVQGPGFTGGRTVSELVSLIDLPPTILRAAGLAKPENMAGMQLQQLVDNLGNSWRDEVFIQISEDHIGRAIRTKNWKYSIWVPSDKGWSGWDKMDSEVYHEQCLYDLINDPFERRNLIADPAYQAVRQELSERLKHLMAEAGETVPDILPCKI